eukprot:TRINITY_DN32610_c0_g1_i1.p1 TRINITY_DN32610_c0_g1~~TRINITY_DN32610_c0_g1_i1.p1  ORF type:complete len:391 (-),score=59.77 TRINITY_DN32610_c0_g1_i1:8-1114(-)
MTGATGFVGYHIAKELVERGYHVRAVVRGSQDTKKTEHLLQLNHGLSSPLLEIVEGDMLDLTSLKDAFQGCRGVVHSAAIVTFTARNPQTDMIDPTVNGTRNALEASRSSGTVRVFVLTSSVAAVVRPGCHPPDFVFTEEDWATTASVSTDPYAVAKRESEKDAHHFVETLSESERFRFVAINPSFVVGPIAARQHVRTSLYLLRDLLNGTYGGIPNFAFGFVDARDVAIAHVNALERETATGRYILSKCSHWLTDICAILRKEHPTLPIPTWRIWNWISFIVGLATRQVSWAFLDLHLGVISLMDGSRAERELGVVYRPLDQSLKETTESLIAHKLVHPRTKSTRLGIVGVVLLGAVCAFVWRRIVS